MNNPEIKKHKRGRPRKETRNNKSCNPVEQVNVEQVVEQVNENVNEHVNEQVNEQIPTTQAYPVDLDEDDDINKEDILYCVLLTKEEYKLLRLFKKFFTKLDKI
jgi:hypothetical protein